jgi:uncharacterized protein (DUF2237 family)
MKKIIHIYIFFMSIVTFAQNKNQTKENCGIASNKDIKINKMETIQLNVLGTELKLASIDPLTGFFRTGFCATDSSDRGLHVVAAVITDEFLKYSLSKGNDLISPYPANGFPGLKAGNVWCLCVLRWKEAFDAGVAPPVIQEATNIKALEYVTIEELQSKKAD